MQIHRGFDQLPTFKNAVLTIGSYDGVHHGHRTILNRLVQAAQESDGESILLTFDPHPRKVVFPNDDSLKLLNTLDERINLLEETGIDHLIIAPFTIEFSQINPYDYVDKILIEKIGVSHLIIGYDHKFGLNREGNIDLLNIYAKQGAFKVEEIAKQDIDDLHVSSTKIRNHITDGNIEKGNLLLGKPFSLSGIIGKGHQLAGSLGFPTANCIISDTDKIIPAPGTYAATASCDGEHYEGMLYIGESKTLINKSKLSIEIHLFSKISEPLYDKEIRIQPLKRIREDQLFDSKKELIYNIQADQVACEQFFIDQKKSKLCTVAILNYNGADWLKKFLPSHLNAQSKNTEVVVIDNASTDDSVDVITSVSSSVQIIELENNYGFAEGYNRGLAQINSKYIAIVNSDVEATPGWLTPLTMALEEDEDLVAVQPKILDYNKPDCFEYAGAAGGFLDSLAYPLSRGRLMNSVEEDNSQYDHPIEIDWASGAAMVVRRSAFFEGGGFDGDFFAHMEEIDLCWRWRKAGWKLKCIPEAKVYHVGGGTLDYQSPHKAFLNLRNNYWMIRKNMPMGQRLRVIPTRICFDTSYSILQVLSGKFKIGIAVLRGMIAGMGSWSPIHTKREKIAFYSKRNKTDKKDIASKIIGILPLAYYLMGKKTFSQLKRR